MKKLYLVVSLFLLGILCVGLLGIYLSRLTFPAVPSPSPTPAATLPSQPSVAPTNTVNPTPPINGNQPVAYTYKVVNIFPHNTSAFTEGLVFENGVLYESTGLYGASSLRSVDLATGVVLHQFNLEEKYFGEGIAIVNDSIFQLTWQSGIGYIYEKSTFTLKENFTFVGEGWGLTYDGSRLIMSNGSSTLTFLNPVTFQPTGTVKVHDGNTSLPNLNELEYVNGDIYANIWMQQKIVIINPQTGQVKGYIDLSDIYQPNNSDDVLNGIAYDQTTGRLFVTGKNWAHLYQITITPKNLTQ